MLTKRIIPCLDIKNGRTVKGVNFVNLRDAGDPVELAKLYSETGADELVFLDISATEERRKTLANMVLQIAEAINIPFTVGGGISSVEDVAILLKNGADKVSINSSAVKNPQLINDLAAKFGSQCIVVAIDAKQIDGEWESIHLRIQGNNKSLHHSRAGPGSPGFPGLAYGMLGHRPRRRRHDRGWGRVGWMFGVSPPG